MSNPRITRLDYRIAALGITPRLTNAKDLVLLRRSVARTSKERHDR